MNKVATLSSPLWMIGSLASLVWLSPAAGQDQPAQDQQQQQPETGAVEEVVVTGRFLSASEQVSEERLQDPSVVDELGADAIGRLGDSTVAAALRRVPGLSLVGNKFVYVRGLGERYSATTLNGAEIPSPDLTRNVIPLDVFPTSVVKSLRVQKTWSPDVWANFGGGSVDIRTQGIPGEFTYSFELGSGYSSATPSTVSTYPGGSDDNLGKDDGTRALSTDIGNALDRYRGDLSSQNIANLNPSLTLDEAAALNRSLSLDVNRNIGIEKKSTPVDENFRASIGDSFDINDNWSLGVLAGGTYQDQWRGTTAYSQDFKAPDQKRGSRNDSVQSVGLSGNVNVGAHFLEDHEIDLTSLYLRNTDDRTTINDFHNENALVANGKGFRDYWLRFEERNMRTNQLQGTHYLGKATRDMFPALGRLLRRVPEETVIHWFDSESKATTDIPNEVMVNSQTVTDTVTGRNVLDEYVEAQTGAGEFRFTRLDDTVNSYGWSVTWPITTEHSRIELKAGSAHSERARTYRQTDLSLGPVPGAMPLDARRGPLDQVFSDSNLVDYNFDFTSHQDNIRSYIAATMTDGVFGMADWTIDDKWRVVVGSRWESYRQAAVAWRPYGVPQVTTNADELKQDIFTSDKAYPALSFTYMGHWWADTFQFRVGASKTAVRPDLREITDASYLDPITGALTYGSSGVVPADVTNLDARAEWFFSSGDNFTVTLFNKDIDKPIEFYAEQGSDTAGLIRRIGNADSAQVRGIEIEWLKKLGFIGPRFDPFFFQGNLTSQTSELVAGSSVNVALRRKRDMVGASPYVANVMFGYDSPNAKHTVSLIYNVFGRRLYVPGDIQGYPDAYEQPFGSLDMTYSWYPTDKLTLKAKAQNLLGDKTKIERAGVQVYELDRGRNFGLSAQWGF